MSAGKEEIPKLTRAQAIRYTRMRNIQEEEVRLQARIRELTKMRRSLSEELTGYFEGRETMRLPGKVILRRKEIIVPAAVIERNGYSYIKWEEIAE